MVARRQRPLGAGRLPGNGRRCGSRTLRATDRRRRQRPPPVSPGRRRVRRPNRRRHGRGAVRDGPGRQFSVHRRDRWRGPRSQSVGDLASRHRSPRPLAAGPDCPRRGRRRRRPALVGASRGEGRTAPFADARDHRPRAFLCRFLGDAGGDHLPQSARCRAPRRILGARGARRRALSGRVAAPCAAGGSDRHRPRARSRRGVRDDRQFVRARSAFQRRPTRHAGGDAQSRIRPPVDGGRAFLAEFSEGDSRGRRRHHASALAAARRRPARAAGRRTENARPRAGLRRRSDRARRAVLGPRPAVAALPPRLVRRRRCDAVHVRLPPKTRRPLPPATSTWRSKATTPSSASASGSTNTAGGTSATSTPTTRMPFAKAPAPIVSHYNNQYDAVSADSRCSSCAPATRGGGGRWPSWRRTSPTSTSITPIATRRPTTAGCSGTPYHYVTAGASHAPRRIRVTRRRVRRRTGQRAQLRRRPAAPLAADRRSAVARGGDRPGAVGRRHGRRRQDDSALVHALGDRPGERDRMRRITTARAAAPATRFSRCSKDTA